MNRTWIGFSGGEIGLLVAIVRLRKTSNCIVHGYRKIGDHFYEIEIEAIEDQRTEYEDIVRGLCG